MLIPQDWFSSLPALLLFAACAGLGCAAILSILLDTGLAWRLATDIPNERSLHARPTPRIGGWGIVPMIALAIAVAAPRLWLIGLCMLLLAAVSQVDDRRGLPARVRFAAHLVAAVLFVARYHGDLPWWVLILLPIALVWLVNLYNFMDGADGMAGGMALIGFGGYACAAWRAGPETAQFAFVCAAIAGAALGFLRFNFHPARIFLGDAGSIPLGFLAGALGLWGWRAHIWPIWFPVMAFAPFICDASVTLLRRLLRGENVWKAHREHYYQRMVRSGMGHRRTALCWYLLMLAGIMLALWTLGRAPTAQWVVVGAWIAVLALIGIAVDVRWRRFQMSGQAEG